MTDAPAPRAAPSGLLLVDKPEGPTSMAVCRRVRWLLVRGGAPKRVKVGHGGTLDPLATGLLVLLVGKATTRCNAIMAGEKEYLADVDLSAFTTTDDREGERTPVDVPAPPALADVEAACRAHTGVIQQRPPAFSAMSVGGERAYRLARAGKPPDLPPRPVHIHALAIRDYAFPRLRLLVRCGKGTYIRSLARDLGRHLGTGGTLLTLRRTEVAPFRIEQAVPFASLPEPLTQDHLRAVTESSSQ